VNCEWMRVSDSEGELLNHVYRQRLRDDLR
jgi:hypothetical protein